MSSHLGADLAALVDGELADAARERVLRHLVACAACRTEVEEQRRLKARLLGLGDAAPDPASDLAARLRALPDVAGAAPSAGRPPGAPGPRRPPRGPAGGRPVRVTAARSAVGGAVLALGLGAVLVLGGPPRQPTRVVVDPAADAFLLDHAGTYGELPLPEPVGVSTAGLGR